MPGSFITTTLFLAQIVGFNSHSKIIHYSKFQSISNLTCKYDSIPHPAWSGNYVYLFRPENKKNCPVVFFCHGINAQDPSNYQAFIKHIVSRGYAVIYSPYPSESSFFFHKESYRILWQGMKAGVTTWQADLDMNNIGFVGHSYGGGAVPCMAHRALINKKWGKESAFLYIMAPWYIQGISQRKLRHFPKYVTMVVEVFTDDKINDHRIGKDIYSAIGIPDSLKVFCVLSSNESSGVQPADHDVPLGSCESSLSVNDLDYSGIYFIFDALTSFTNNTYSADRRFCYTDMVYNVSGSSKTVCRITILKKPQMKSTQKICVNFWSHAMNPRRKFYRYLGKPLRLVIGTPETIIHYGALAVVILGSKL